MHLFCHSQNVKQKAVSEHICLTIQDNDDAIANIVQQPFRKKPDNFSYTMSDVFFAAFFHRSEV